MGRKRSKKSCLHRRGNFSVLRCGVSHGGGQTQPMNFVNTKKNGRILEGLNSRPSFRRIASFGSCRPTPILLLPLLIAAHEQLSFNLGHQSCMDTTPPSWASSSMTIPLSKGLSTVFLLQLTITLALKPLVSCISTLQTYHLATVQSLHWGISTPHREDTLCSGSASW